jgi:hypothetical protein
VTQCVDVGQDPGVSAGSHGLIVCADELFPESCHGNGRVALHRTSTVESSFEVREVLGDEIKGFT